MADWQQQDDTHTAKINGYTARVIKTMFGGHTYTVTDGERIVRAGDSGSHEASKMQAEKVIEELPER